MKDRTTITIRIPSNIKKELKQEAIAKGITLNGLISQALWDFCTKRKMRRTDYDSGTPRQIHDVLD